MNDWKIPSKNPYVKIGKFPFGIMLTITAVIFLIFISTAILTLPQGKGITSDFIREATFSPVVLCMWVWSIVVWIYMALGYPYHYASHLEKYGLQRWRKWAIESLPVLDYAFILPVPELALKIQKLEGEAPISPATPLRINIETDTVNESRIEKILMQLIEPMKQSLIRGRYPFNSWIYVKGGNESDCVALRNVFDKIAVPVDRIGTIKNFTECPSYSYLNKWTSEGMYGNNLFITIELHSDNDSAFFESANAFIFTSGGLLSGNDTPLYLLRMMDSDIYSLDKRLGAYFSAKQVEAGKIKRLWSSSLSKQAKYILYGEVENAKTGIQADSRYELEAVMGKSSDVQRWVALGLAADAAKYGQGHQLVVSADKETIHCGLVASKYPGHWNEYNMPDMQIHWYISMLCASLFWLISYFFVIPTAAIDKHPWLWGSIAVIGFLVSFLGTAFLYVHRSCNIDNLMGIYYIDN